MIVDFKGEGDEFEIKRHHIMFGPPGDMMAIHKNGRVTTYRGDPYRGEVYVSADHTNVWVKLV